MFQTHEKYIQENADYRKQFVQGVIQVIKFSDSRPFKVQTSKWELDSGWDQ